ncbi:MAG: discoidin domain-containing protein [Acidimicrobiia bacterium]|nr:discoidin domain-containing protein [Acidimicrobiia bacterium]
MRFAALTLVLALLTTACESSGEGVLPFSDIQAGELSFELDPLDPTRAVFRVTTTEPSICSIAWGPTESLGNQNNSLSMNGTGIIQHDVILPGIEPGGTYFFTLQGATADGQLFKSELATFTLPESDRPVGTDDPVDLRTNLALTASAVEASSEFSASFAASQAIDGDLTTEWSTRGDGDSGYLVLDLGQDVEIGGIEFITRSMADGSAITTEFTVTVDGGEVLGPFPAGTPREARTAGVSVTGRLLRFDIATSTGGNTGAIEIRVLAPDG